MKIRSVSHSCGNTGIESILPELGAGMGEKNQKNEVNVVPIVSSLEKEVTDRNV